MDMRLLRENGRKIIVFVVQFCILLFCISYIEFIYSTNIYPDKHIKETYEQATCNIVLKKMSTKGRFVHEYRADFLLTYPGEGELNQVWVSGNGLDRSFSPDKSAQQDLLDQYEQGSSYPCWYNPDDLRMVVLNLRHNWTSTFPLFIPSVIGLIMVYSLSRAVIELLSQVFANYRQRRQ